MNNNSLNILGQLRLMETRGYSAYEVAQLNGYTGTEQEWLESLVGPQGPQGIDGRSAYQVAVDNGYIGTEEDWVNDFMTPDGYYNKEEVDEKFKEIEFIFPKLWEGRFSGDCNLIKYKNINILVDCYRQDAWEDVKKMLDDNNVSHIDYFMISHFHGDHYGNYQNLISNGYIDENTQVYLPAIPTQFNWDTQIISNVKTYLDENNISYSIPNDNQILNLDDLKITFGNTDADYMDTYYTTRQQNDCSMVLLIEFKNMKAFYGGDAGTLVQKHLYETNFTKGNIDLYKICHHGIDLYCYSPFIRNMSPKYAVQPTGILDFKKNNFGLCEDVRILESLGTKIYPTHMQRENYITFVSNGNGLQNIFGEEYSTSNQYENITLYVDINNQNVYENGTEEYPFHEVMQAISYASKIKCSEITINCADGTYCMSHESTTSLKNRLTINNGLDTHIIINGNSEDRTAVVLDHGYIDNSYVTINSCTFNVDNANALYCYNSHLTLTNVLITSMTGTKNNSNSGLIVRMGSKVSLLNSEIELCNQGIIAQTNSEVIIYNMTFGDVNTPIGKSNSIVYTNGSITFYNDTMKNAFNLYNMLDKRTPEDVIITHEDYATTINLTKSIQDVEWVEVFLRTNDNRYLSTGKLYEMNQKRAGIVIPHYTGNLYNKQCNLYFIGNKINIEEQCQIYINQSNAVQVLTGNNFFNVEKVIVGYKDYIS